MMFNPQDAISSQARLGADAVSCSSFQDWYCQGEEFANGHDYGKALRCFEEAAILCPTNLDVLVYQAVCWIHLNQPAKALTVTDSILAYTPEHSQGWLFRGVALHRLGHYGEAYACYDRALGQAPRGGVVARVKHFFSRLLTKGWLRA